MKYKDLDSINDTPECPAARKKQVCLNCKHGWADHSGRACPGKGDGHRNFHDLYAEERYLTQSMKDSLAPAGPVKPLKEILKDAYAPSEPKKADLSDWRTWAKTRPGECACGIPTHQCKYHGGARV